MMAGSVEKEEALACEYRCHRHRGLEAQQLSSRPYRLPLPPTLLFVYSLFVPPELHASGLLLYYSAAIYNLASRTCHDDMNKPA